MKIAVLGGGTAGYIAATHLTKMLPNAELVHVFSSQIPTIGVGEGTTPRFPGWLAETTGLSFEDIVAHCDGTLKHGTRFDGWGAAPQSFTNRFHPASSIGYHFDAAKVVALMSDHVRARYVDAKVSMIENDGVEAIVHLEEGQSERCDYVIDARGFPAGANSGRDQDGAELIRLDWIPTGKAQLRWLPRVEQEAVTRAVARPHGWIFMIPLKDRISAGYLYNGECATEDEVSADYDAFLSSEGITGWSRRGELNFPNFLRRELFDGRVFRVGNAASFVEPLEATSIGASILQVRNAAHWISHCDPKGPPVSEHIAHFNKAMRTYVIRNSLFISWHYACGAPWDTPFWRYASQGLERAAQNPDAAMHLESMYEFVEAGQALPGPMLSKYDDAENWQSDIYPLLKLFVPYGNFSELNFAQVGHGIGFYEKGAAA